VSLHADLGFLENWWKQYFGVSNFTVLSVINSPGQSHSCLTEAILSKGLTQSKTLDCGDSGELMLSHC